MKKSSRRNTIALTAVFLSATLGPGTAFAGKKPADEFNRLSDAELQLPVYNIRHPQADRLEAEVNGDDFSTWSLVSSSVIGIFDAARLGEKPGKETRCPHVELDWDQIDIDGKGNGKWSVAITSDEHTITRFREYGCAVGPNPAIRQQPIFDDF